MFNFGTGTSFLNDRLKRIDGKDNVFKFEHLQLENWGVIIITFLAEKRLLLDLRFS